MIIHTETAKSSISNKVLQLHLLGLTLLANQQSAYLSWQKQKYNKNVPSVAVVSYE
jgi:hypothetical protein